MSILKIPKLKHLNSGNFVLIAGPCVVENEDISMEIANKICQLSNKFKIPFVFKGSFKKANRTKIDSFTGIGDLKSLSILKKVGNKFDIPTITDIHETKIPRLFQNLLMYFKYPLF